MPDTNSDPSNDQQLSLSPAELTNEEAVEEVTDHSKENSDDPDSKEKITLSPADDPALESNESVSIDLSPAKEPSEEKKKQTDNLQSAMQQAAVFQPDTQEVKPKKEEKEEEKKEDKKEDKKENKEKEQPPQNIWDMIGEAMSDVGKLLSKAAVKTTKVTLKVPASLIPTNTFKAIYHEAADPMMKQGERLEAEGKPIKSRLSKAGGVIAGVISAAIGGTPVIFANIVLAGPTKAAKLLRHKTKRDFDQWFADKNVIDKPAVRARRKAAAAAKAEAEQTEAEAKSKAEAEQTEADAKSKAEAEANQSEENHRQTVQQDEPHQAVTGEEAQAPELTSKEANGSSGPGADPQEVQSVAGSKEETVQSQDLATQTAQRAEASEPSQSALPRRDPAAERQKWSNPISALASKVSNFITNHSEKVKAPPHAITIDVGQGIGSARQTGLQLSHQQLDPHQNRISASEPELDNNNTQSPSMR